MKRTVAVIIMFCFVVMIANSQNWKQMRLEGMAGVGTTQFFGDIGGYSEGLNLIGLKDISLLQTRFNVSAAVKYKILEDLSVRVNFAFGLLHATDQKGSNEARGFESNATIIEPSLMAEYYFIKSKLSDNYLFNQGRRMNNLKIFSALDFYAFAGIGGLSYSVKGNDKLIAQGLQTGGFTGTIPAGLGVNLLLTSRYNLGIELGGRYALSDYLDGYASQYSSSNDVYYFFDVTFTYRFETRADGWPAFLKKRRF
jgi:hypothetical protein